MTHNQTTAIKATKARVEPSTTRTLSLEHSARLMRRCCWQAKLGILLKPCHGSRP